MCIWLQSVNLFPHRIVSPDDVLRELSEMVLRGDSDNCFQINESELNALASGV